MKLKDYDYRIIPYGKYFIIDGGGQLYEVYKDPDCINDIRLKTKSLTSFDNDYVVVEITKDYFFQSLRLREMGKTSKYEIEVGFKKDNERKLYRTVGNKQRVLELFESICSQSKFPDLTDWEDIQSFITENRVKDEKLDSYKRVIKDYYDLDCSEMDSPAIKYLFKRASTYIWENNHWRSSSNHFWGLTLTPKDYKYIHPRSSNPILAHLLGDMYLYGYKNGKVDYKKALYYYDYALKTGNLNSQIQIAKMYKHGLGVEKNIKKYVKLVRDTYLTIQRYSSEKNIFCHNPEILLELSYAEEINGNIDTSRALLNRAIRAQSIANEFGNIDSKLMQKLINRKYEIDKIDYKTLKLEDLLYILQKPSTVIFNAFGKEYTVRSIIKNERLLVNFNGVNYNGILKFFEKAIINDTPIARLPKNITSIKVLD